MVGPLDLLLLSDTGLLKKVRHNVATSELSRSSEVDSDELSKSGGVVVPRSLGVAVGLQNGVGGHDLVLEGDLLGVLLGPSSSSNHGQVGDHLLGVLRLSSARFASDEHSIVLLVLEHVAISAFCDGPEVKVSSML